MAAWKMESLLCFVFTSLINLVRSGHDHYNFDPSRFNYKDTKSWSREYPACGGRKQSPVNINPGNVILDSSIPFILHASYDLRLKNLRVENHGHTVTFYIPEGARVHVTRGGLDGDYYLKQFHFHWAQEDTLGSEHTIHGLHFPLELHLVHYKEGMKPEKAASIPGGIAVIAVLFLLSEDGVPLADVTDALSRLRKPGDNTTVEYLTLQHLLPYDKSSFYRYNGSLTTPPCSENVIWTVYAEPQHVDAVELAKFRKVRNLDNEILQRNYRPVQPISRRKIYLRNVNVPFCSNQAVSHRSTLRLKYCAILLLFSFLLI